MKPRAFIVGVLISVLTMILLTLFGEFYVRNFVLVTKSSGNCTLLDPIVKFRGAPGSECSSRTPEWNVTNKHNSFGLRSPEISLDKKEGAYRILYLGDSFVQGYGVEEGKSFPRLVEKELNKKYQGKPNIEVINAGVPNYSPLLEYLYLKNYGLKFDPDLVILEFDLTDFSNDLAYALEATYENGVPVAVPATPSASNVDGSTPSAQEKSKETKVMSDSKLLPFVSSDLKKFFHDNSVLYKWVSTQLKIMLGQPLADPEAEGLQNFYTIVKDDTSHDSDLWKRPKQNLKLINDLLKSNEVPFVVSAHPHAILVDGKEWSNGRLLHGLERGRVYSDRYFTEMASFLSGEQIPFINLLPYLRESDMRNLYFPFDGHFNERGHKVAADGIINELNKQNIVDVKKT